MFCGKRRFPMGIKALGICAVKAHMQGSFHTGGLFLAKVLRMHKTGTYQALLRRVSLTLADRQLSKALMGNRPALKKTSQPQHWCLRGVQIRVQIRPTARAVEKIKKGEGSQNLCALHTGGYKPPGNGKPSAKKPETNREKTAMKP